MENYNAWDRSARDFDSIPTGCITRLAPQQKLGLRAERRAGIGRSNLDHPAALRTHLIAVGAQKGTRRIGKGSSDRPRIS